MVLSTSADGRRSIPVIRDTKDSGRWGERRREKEGAKREKKILLERKPLNTSLYFPNARARFRYTHARKLI